MARKGKGKQASNSLPLDESKPVRSYHPSLHGIGYLGDAVFLATSTLVRLLLENFIIHNHKYFVLCTGATFLRRRMTVLRAGGRVAGTLQSARDSSAFVTCTRPHAMRAENRMFS